jgi:hypothetical protein
VPGTGGTLAPHPAAWKLEALSELAERLAEYALNLDRDNAAKIVQTLGGHLAEAKALLRPATAARMTARMRQAINSDRRGDLTSLSLAAIELHRLAIREIPLDARRTPIRINLLGYVGLKLMAFAQQVPTNWTAVHSAVGEASIYTHHLGSSVDGLCVDALLQTVSALTKALETRERQEVERAARRLYIIALRLSVEHTQLCVVN